LSPGRVNDVQIAVGPVVVPQDVNGGERRVHFRGTSRGDTANARWRRVAQSQSSLRAQENDTGRGWIAPFGLTGFKKREERHS
jgi:hypothetical protein